MSKEKFDITKIRCIHRHYWPDHKSCFAKGRVDYEFKDDRDFSRKTGLPWHYYYPKSIGYFDIETDNLNADFGTVLSWAFKEKDGPIYTDVITKEEIFNGTYDKRIVESFINKMKEFRIVMGYYSTGFDLPYMRAKALHYDLEFPSYGDNYHWDLYYTVKSKLKISRKSLDNACDYLGIVGKTPISKDAWRKAKYGDKESLDVVLEHNIGDVIILEKLHEKLDFTRKWIRSSI